jgi:hypothetical protein
MVLRQYLLSHDVRVPFIAPTYVEIDSTDVIDHAPVNGRITANDAHLVLPASLQVGVKDCCIKGLDQRGLRSNQAYSISPCPLHLVKANVLASHIRINELLIQGVAHFQHNVVHAIGKFRRGY